MRLTKGGMDYDNTIKRMEQSDMSNLYGPRIVTDGLVLHLDAANRKSYPGSGTSWNDLSGNGNHFTIGSSLTFSNNTFLMDSSPDGGGGANRNSSTAIPNSTACTLVFWIKSTELQSLFWGSDTTNGGSYFVGAYRVGNKEYYGNTTGSGAKAYYQDLSEKANIYDYFPDGNWHMIEFKNVDFSTWTNQHTFNSYSTFTFGNGAVGVIKMYNKILTLTESLQNYNALKGRFGL